MRPKRREEPDEPMPLEVCYCNGKRDLGSMELHCNGCKKWFHHTCLRDLKELFSYGLPFMVCYVFHCGDCASDRKESWSAKQTNFAHMCIMALANMVVNHFREVAGEDADLAEVIENSDTKFFKLDSEIIPFFDENWESLTPIPRRVKNTWHATIHKTLLKETELFISDENDENAFTLKERDLLTIGPMHRAVRNLGKRVPTNAAANENAEEPEGPKTRGASKRRQPEPLLSATVPKRARTVGSSESTPLSEAGGLSVNVDYPFNRADVRFQLAEEDPNAAVADALLSDFRVVPIAESNVRIGHNYRIAVPPSVQLSPNDRAHQLRLEPDGLTVTGYGGYSMARANHSVAHGRWYFEVEFLSQPGDSHVRIGWSRDQCSLQACVGYSRFSYGWRSLKGTAFHDGYGHTYATPGFAQGDIMGCLIDLPSFEDQCKAGRPASAILPDSLKAKSLVKFKSNSFFENHVNAADALKTLREIPGTRIEFFLNGRSRGPAFFNIIEGAYFPAVSLFHDATLRCNFGPRLRYPLPRNARPLSERPEQFAVEQTLSDILAMVCAAFDSAPTTSNGANSSVTTAENGHSMSVAFDTEVNNSGGNVSAAGSVAPSE